MKILILVFVKSAVSLVGLITIVIINKNNGDNAISVT